MRPEFRPLRRFSRPISACFDRFKLVSVVSAVSVSGRYGRYGPSRPDLGHVGADFGRVGSSRDPPRGATRHDAGRTRGLRRPSRVPLRQTRVRWPGSRVRASQLITQNTPTPYTQPIWHRHSLIIIQYFSTVCGPIPVTWSEQSY